MKIVDVHLTEDRVVSFDVTLEVPGDTPDELVKTFVEKVFCEDRSLFDQTDVELANYEVLNIRTLEGDEAASAQEYRKKDEASITMSCMLRRWLDELPEPGKAEKRLVVVDDENYTGYIGDEDNGVYYTVEEHDTFWYASAIVDCLNFADNLFIDAGPFSNELQAIDHCQIEAGSWCSINDVEILDGTPGEPPTADSVKLSEEILDLFDTKAGRALLAVELVKACCEHGDRISSVDAMIGEEGQRLMVSSDLILFVVKCGGPADDGYLFFEEKKS